MTIATCDNQSHALSEAGKRINDLLSHYSESPILFLFCGGSGLALLNTIEKRNLDSNITFAPTDDRYSYDETVNNFLQMMFLPEFYQNAIESGCQFISTYPDQMESMPEVADSLEIAIRKWKRQYPEGIVIATMGMGPDGHTAGIMPYPEDTVSFHEFFMDEDRWVVAYDALDKNEYPLRISITLPFLKKYVDHAVLFFCGKPKNDAYQRLLAETGSLPDTPARIAQEMKDVHIFTDIKL